MQEVDAHKVVVRILSAWPKKIPDETVLVWYEHLGRLNAEQAMAAVHEMEMVCRTQPSLSEFHEHYRALATRFPTTRSLGPPQCGMCDDGWVSVRCNTWTHRCDCGDGYTRAGNRCPRGAPTMERCPNGCKPRTQEEWADVHLAEDARFDRERQARRDRCDGPPKFAPLGGVVHHARELDDQEEVF